jgi:C-terminal peptidase prc
MPADTITQQRCPGCFAVPAPDGPCPSCGFDRATARPANALPLDTLLDGQFIVGRVLGNPGGFGITYLGFDIRLETTVAIKEYLPRDLATRSADRATVVAHTAQEDGLFRYGLEQFLTEARTLAKLDHPNIVRVRHFFEANDSAYLVMDYYRGLTLAEYLDRQPGDRVREDKAIALLQPVLDGLRAVHAKGMLHRDIKPGNIYLAQTDTGGVRPILLDFGAARQAMGERSRSLSVVLSEGYAPFEQYHRKGKQGTWTDVYAAAAVLYRMVTGKTPPDAVERQHADEMLPAARLGVSSSVSGALEQAMRMDAAGRPQRIEQLQALLTASATGSVSSSIAPNPQVDVTRVQPARRVPSRSPKPPRQGKGTARQRKSTRMVSVILANVLIFGLVATLLLVQSGIDSSPSAPGTIAAGRSDGPFQTAADTMVSGFAQCRADDCRLSIITPAALRPDGAEAFQAFSPGERMEIQRWLKRLGYSAETAPGQFDDTTRKAIQDFQASRSLSATGFVDQTTYERLTGEVLRDDRHAATTQSSTEPLAQKLLVVSKVLERFHYVDFELDGPFAMQILRDFALSLDPGRLYLLQSDLDTAAPDPQRIARELSNGDLQSFFGLFRLYRQRAAARFDAISAVLADGFDFSRQERLELHRANPRWAATQRELDVRWEQRLKDAALEKIIAGTAPPAAYRQLRRRFVINPDIGLAEWSADDVGHAAINAFASVIDGTGTEYVSAEQVAERAESASARFEGIGAVLTTDEDSGYTSISRVLAGGPAEHAGVRNGELIVAVDTDGTGQFESTAGQRLTDVVQVIRGEGGSAVRLRIAARQPGGTLRYREVALVRDAIDLQGPRVRMVPIAAAPSLRIALVKLPAFYRDFAGEASGTPNFDSSARDLARIVEDLKRQGIDGIILDLRGNEGGALTEAAAIARLFVQSDVIVMVKDAVGDVEQLGADSPPGTYFGGPLAVLVDHDSAAASEIVAAAVQDTNRGPVLGMRTNGRGTVQTLIDLDRYLTDGPKGLGQLRMTMAMLFRANGESIQQRGVLPDLLLPYSRDTSVLPREEDRKGAPDAERSTPVAVPNYGFRLSASVINAHRERMRSDPVFQFANQRLERWETAEQRPERTLNAAERRRARQIDQRFEREQAAVLHSLVADHQAEEGSRFDDVLSRRVETEAARVLADSIRSGAFRAE